MLYKESVKEEEELEVVAKAVDVLFMLNIEVPFSPSFLSSFPFLSLLLIISLLLLLFNLLL